MTEYKYLHTVGDNCFWLDHRIVPEVRALLCAKMSRAPRGGIRVRYQELLDAISKEGYEWDPEDRLCVYPLHSAVQSFFDINVKNYGHGSIKELTGTPSVFVEGLSWWLAWMSFDNPLVRGQEMSTRALWRRDWPMAVDVDTDVDPRMAEIHELGLKITAAEIQAWKAELRSIDHKGDMKYPWIKDPQAFRPAFDRARWALPGTIATGVSHAGDIRTMGRVVQAMRTFCKDDPKATKLVDEIVRTYREALPGMADMWLAEAHTEGDNEAPLDYRFSRIDEAVHPEVSPTLRTCWVQDPADGVRTHKHRKYSDPEWNHSVRMSMSIPGSIAGARDWHRHRTAMPWTFKLQEPLHINVHYKPLSVIGKDLTPRYLALCASVYRDHMEAGRTLQALLALPLGTNCTVQGQAGEAYFRYITELRAYAHGANFEYEKAAKVLLDLYGEPVDMTDTDYNSVESSMFFEPCDA